MIELEEILDWVHFMHPDEAERYKIEVQQTWAKSLGFFGRFIARHYSWFLAAFKRLGAVKIAVVWLTLFAALLSRIGIWEKNTIIGDAVILCIVGLFLLWCFFLSFTMASNWKRVDYANFRKTFVPKEIELIVLDLEPRLPGGGRLIVEYFGGAFLIGVAQPSQEARYFGCWSGRSRKHCQLLFPQETIR